MPLTLRLTLTYLLVTLGGLLLLGSGAVALAGRYAAQQRAQELGGQADIYAAYLAEVVGSAQELRALAPLLERGALPPGVLARIFALDGTLLTSEQDLGPFPSRAALPLLVSGLPLPVSQLAERRYVARTIMGRSSALGVVELSQSTDAEQQLRGDLLRTLVQATLLATLVMALVSLLVARSIARPIMRIQRQAEALAEGALDQRLHGPTVAPPNDELGRLAQSLDRMAAQLQARIEEAEGEHARLDAVLASISEGVLALDQAGALLFANPAAERLLGSDGLAVTSYELRVRSEEQQRTLLRQLQALELPPTLTQPLEREFSIGDRQLLIIGTPVSTDNRPTTASEIQNPKSKIQNVPASVWVIRDMTRIKQLEQARARFFRAISHELRTPLTAIGGVIENLRDDARPDQQAQLATLEEETARLARLVGDLLRPSADGALVASERRPLDLGLLASELCALQQGRARRAGITLSYAAKPGRHTIAGDRDRLKQALLNLLDNALKATPAGGEVRVEVGVGGRGLGIGGREPGYVVVVVEDSGPGIPSELAERVWERGVSGAMLGLEDSGGAGLGLALVREIVVAHAGRASLEQSAALGGARFVIELPGD